MIKTERALGIYVMATALLQALVFVWMTAWPEQLWLFTLDPRIGFMFLRESTRPGAMQWGSVVIIVVLASGLISRRMPLDLYLGIEFMLVIPSLVFFAVILFANMSPSHGFSVWELLVPALVFAVFSGVPMYSACRLPRPE